MADNTLPLQVSVTRKKIADLLSLYDAIDWSLPGAEAGRPKLAALSSDLARVRYFLADLSVHVSTAAAAARAAALQGHPDDPADAPG
jgi:hypothetical protein